MEKFLANLRDSANVREACASAGVPRSTVYYWRDKFKTFETKWDEALEDACDLLEKEARQRAIKEKSDRLLMFLLKAHRPEKYKERQEVKHAGDVTVKGYVTFNPDQWDGDGDSDSDV